MTSGRDETDEERLDRALVLLAAVTTALVLAPVAVHRQLTGEHVKERIVVASHRLANAALVSISLLVAGMVVFIVDMVVDRTWAALAGGAITAVLVLLLVVVPRRLSTD